MGHLSGLLKSHGSDRADWIQPTGGKNLDIQSTIVTDKVNESFSHLFRYNYEGECVPLVQGLGNLYVVTVDTQRCFLFYFFLRLKKKLQQ